MTVRTQNKQAVDGSEQQWGSHGPLVSETYVPQTMPQVLGKRDMTITAVMALFLLTNAVSGAGGGPVSLVYLGLGALVFFLPCVVAAVQLGVLLPNEGSIYNWTTRALNPFMGFFIGLCFWLSGVLAVTTAGSAFVTTLQGLNANMLNQPWQQGVVILVLTALVARIACSRMRMIQTFINMVFLMLLVSVLLVGAAALVWLATGHHSVTNFTDPGGWTPTPSTFFLFAIITLNYVGASGPLNLAGELRGRGTRELPDTVRKDLLIGAPVVVLLYTVVTTSVLIVRGSSVGPFDGFTAVQQTLGRVPADIAVICYLMYLVAAMLFYTYASARLIMAAGIDQFLPVIFTRLSKKTRAPSTAVVVHALATALVVILVYILVPALFTVGGNAVNTTTEFYTVIAAACTLIWTIATLFFFVDLVGLYRRDPQKFRGLLQFPPWLIWGSVVVGGAACLGTVVAILVYPWIPLIANDQWWYLVGGLTLGILIIAALFSSYGSAQANYEQMSR